MPLVSGSRSTRARSAPVMHAATAMEMPADEQLTTQPASASKADAIIRQATLCSSAMFTEWPTSSATAAITSAATGLAPIAVSVPEALMMRERP